jgi:lipopolysaccharide/colanic/teichoic acid biosynthesis glycosyltransferase
VVVAALAPMPARLHFRLALAVCLAVLMAAMGGGQGFDRAVGVKRWRYAEACVGRFLAALAIMRLVAGLLDRGGLMTADWMAADALATSAALAGIRLARWPARAGARGAGGTIVILEGTADERGIEAAILARAVMGAVAGVYSLGGESRAGGWPVIHPGHLNSVLRDGGVSDVVFAGRRDAPHEGGEGFAALFRDMFTLPVRVWLALDVEAVFPGGLPEAAGRYRLVPMLGEATLSAGNPFKRAVDILAGAALLALVSPLLAGIALALRMSGTRDVLFRQMRIGVGGRPFALLKFRTMTGGDDAVFVQARPGDPRVTRLGRWLRRTSLDELPQLVNVVRGEMSLVGPRPHAPATTVAGQNFEAAAKFYRLRYRVKPGMTGLAQIRGQRGATDDVAALERRVTSDLEYIESWSLGLDFLILLRTVPAVLWARNAY